MANTSSQPPIIVKHEILERLERLSRDYGKVSSIRKRLEQNASVDELARSLVRNGVVDERVARALVAGWADPNGWLGPIMGEVREKFLEAARMIGDGGPYLSAWWILGATDRFRLFVHPLGDRVLLLMCTPHLPNDIRAGKREFDFSFDDVLRQYIEELRRLLLPG